VVYARPGELTPADRDKVNAWALRRWRVLLVRVRDVDRTADVLICLGRWLHRIPA
jgi:hypothetical protein